MAHGAKDLAETQAVDQFSNAESQPSHAERRYPGMAQVYSQDSSGEAFQDFPNSQGEVPLKLD